MRRPREVHLLLRARASRKAHQARALGGRCGDLLSHSERLRPQADSHVPAGRARRPHRRQDRAQDDARDGDPLRHPPRNRLPPLQLVQGRRREGLRERAGPGLRGRRPMAEDGHRRDRVQMLLRQGVPRAGLRLRQPRDRRMVDSRVSEPRAAGGDARYAAAEGAAGRPARNGQRHGLAVPAPELLRKAPRGGHRAEHVAQGQLPGQRVHGRAVRPYQGRVLPRQGLGRLRVLQDTTSRPTSSIGTRGGGRRN